MTSSSVLAPLLLSGLVFSDSESFQVNKTMMCTLHHSEKRLALQVQQWQYILPCLVFCIYYITLLAQEL